MGIIKKQRGNIDIQGFDLFDAGRNLSSRKALEVFVSPNGSNNARGTKDDPFKTAAYAYYHVIPPEGGILRVARAAKWSDGTEGTSPTVHDGSLGLTDRQGAWTRNDGWAIPGWLPGKHYEVGAWGGGDVSQFSDCVASLDQWGLSGDNPASQDRTQPSIWITNSSTTHHFRRISIHKRQPVRLGWDYRRNEADGSIAWANITHASRVDAAGFLYYNGILTPVGLTTITVNNPAPFVITQMSRSGNVTTARIQIHQQNNVGTMVGRMIHVTSTDGSFASGDYTIQSATGLGGNLEDITYAETGANASLRTVTGCSMGGHLVKPQDFIETQTSNSQFPGTFYWVKSVTPTTITYYDPWGGNGGRSAAVAADNIGTYVLQNRPLTGVSFVTFHECAIGVAGGTLAGHYENGPGVDISGSTGFPVVFRGGVYTGTSYDDGTSLHQGCRDQNVAAAILAACGSEGASGYNAYDLSTLSGSLRLQAGVSVPGGATIKDVLQDVDIGQAPYPTFTAFGTGNLELHLEHVVQADAPSNNSIDLGGVTGSVVMINCGPAVGTRNTHDSSARAIAIAEHNFQQDWRGYLRSWPSQGKLGHWGGDGRIAGKRIDVQRQFGVYQGLGPANLVDENVTHWTEETAGYSTVTANQSTLTLNGRSDNKAYRLTGLGDTGIRLAPGITTAAAALGDHVVIGVFLKAVNTSKLLPGAPITFGYSDRLSLAAWTSGFGGDGEWRWFTCIEAVSAVDVGQTTLRCALVAGSVDDYLVYRPRVHFLPASTYTENEAFDFYETFRAWPTYLAAGCAGTDEGVILIGHGGLGVDTSIKKVVGGGSGQLTLAGTQTYVPLYAANGTTIITWIRGEDATVNP